jgi:hypothetical protein
MAVAQGKHRSLDCRPAVAHRLPSGLPCQIRIHEQGWKAAIRGRGQVSCGRARAFPDCASTGPRMTS